MPGFNAMVRSCSDYADTTGHLTDDAKGPIGHTIGSFYASGQVPAAPPPMLMIAPPLEELWEASAAPTVTAHIAR